MSACRTARKAGKRKSLSFSPSLSLSFALMFFFFTHRHRDIDSLSRGICLPCPHFSGICNIPAGTRVYFGSVSSVQIALEATPVLHTYTCTQTNGRVRVKTNSDRNIYSHTQRKSPETKCTNILPQIANSHTNKHACDV